MHLIAYFILYINSCTAVKFSLKFCLFISKYEAFKTDLVYFFINNFLLLLKYINGIRHGLSKSINIIFKQQTYYSYFRSFMIMKTALNFQKLIES